MTECAVCGKDHDKADGVVTVAMGREWRFCSETCRNEWRDDTHE